MIAHIPISWRHANAILAALTLLSAPASAQADRNLPPDSVVAMTVRQAYQGITISPRARAAAEARIRKFLADRSALPAADEPTRAIIDSLRVALVADLRKLVPNEADLPRYDANMRNAIPASRRPKP
jgi:hypothetical protein